MEKGCIGQQKSSVQLTHQAARGNASVGVSDPEKCEKQVSAVLSIMLVSYFSVGTKRSCVVLGMSHCRSCPVSASLTLSTLENGVWKAQQCHHELYPSLSPAKITPRPWLKTATCNKMPRNATYSIKASGMWLSSWAGAVLGTAAPPPCLVSSSGDVQRATLPTPHQLWCPHPTSSAWPGFDSNSSSINSAAWSENC